MSGFGVEFYNKFIKESDWKNYVNYIEKSSKEQKIEKELYEERQKGTKPKTIAKLENMLFTEREKRSKWMVLWKRLQADPNWGGSVGSIIGVGIILGYKYLDGSIKTDRNTILVKKNSLEIRLRINWWAMPIINSS